MSLPDFNRTCSIWIPGNSPSLGPPDYTDVPCQMYIASRMAFGSFPKTANSTLPVVVFRLPNDQLIANPPPYVGGVIGIVLAGYGNGYYSVQWWDVIHYGFPNAYLTVETVQCDSTGVAPDPGR